MKLTIPALSINEKLDEFDFWITPSLGDITSSSRYIESQDLICSLIEIIGKTTNKFENVKHFSADSIAKTIVNHISKLTQAEKCITVTSLATFLFLATGKSDNNIKCQFPLFLRDVSDLNTFPKVTTNKGVKKLSEVSIPRVIKSERIATLISELSDFPQKQLEILTQYTKFILDKEQYRRSFWSIGKTYFAMKKIGFEKDFLQPLIVFQVRGSVSAFGGHEPENSLRDRMTEWGLLQDCDFNNSDIIVKEEIVEGEKIEIVVEQDNTAETIIEKKQAIKDKTRAYDFVLPYKVKGWKQKIFVQCQFYAGDSGSVSHKNVDQIKTSREFVKTKRNDAIFLEYIDGAGYFSSLWGDLKKILEMKDTADFFQVRTAVIKLRSHLQNLGFLTPLEVVHAWALKDGNFADIIEHLKSEGYGETEILRVLERESFTKANDKLEVDPKIIDLSRKYLLLDFIAVKGMAFSTSEKIVGSLLVPAFGKYFGIKIGDIATNIIPEAGIFKEDWLQSGQILKDIQFLADQGWIVQR